MGGFVLVLAPFLLAYAAIDLNGIDIAGTVYSKHEYLLTRDSTWSGVAEMAVEYWPPDGSSVRFLNTKLPPADYDKFAKGQRVTVRYLRQRDIPKVLFSETLGKLQILPVARLGGRNALSGIRDFLATPARYVVLWAAGVVALLVIWRMTRLPGFAWAVVACLVASVGAALVDDFPLPTPAPAGSTLQATARVQGVDTIDKLFDGSRSRGIEAAQPIHVVALEFIPAGRTEPVVAIDAIDAGSIPGLKQDVKLTLDYEAGKPRVAHIRGATRNFPQRNLRGIGFEIVIGIAVLGGLLLFITWAGRAWDRLLSRR